jgi:1,6-anhydro-N-acetylmuramate kinase
VLFRSNNNSQQKKVEISFVEFEVAGTQWAFKITCNTSISYSEALLQEPALIGNWLAEQMNLFIEANALHYKIQLIGISSLPASDASEKELLPVTANGAVIAAHTGINTVSDFFNAAAALGGSNASFATLSNQLPALETGAPVEPAVLIAFAAVLRWREEPNCFAVDTGASQNTCGGAIWLGQQW